MGRSGEAAFGFFKIQTKAARKLLQIRTLSQAELGLIIYLGRGGGFFELFANPRVSATSAAS